MNKKTQSVLFLSIFSIMILFLSLTSISPNVIKLYDTLFEVDSNNAINLFLQPFTGVVSFFVILLSIISSGLFTLIFVIVFPIITGKNLLPEDGYLPHYIGGKTKITCIIIMILVVVLGSIYRNPFLAVLVVITYVLPMYLLYNLSNKIIIKHNLRQVRLDQEIEWFEDVTEQNQFENKEQYTRDTYESMGYNQNRRHRY